jgi:hypothetical protein
MDLSTDKKWFVYLRDHHEGPFTLEEIQEKMAQQLFSSASYVWAEGMADWQMMTEVPEFSALVKNAHGETSLDVKATEEEGALDESTTQVSRKEGAALEEYSEEENAQEVLDSGYRTIELNSSGEALSQKNPERESSEVSEGKVAPQEQLKREKTDCALGRFGRLFFAFCGLFVLCSGGLLIILMTPQEINLPDGASLLKAKLHQVHALGRPYVQKGADVYPVLSKWISPLPLLPGVAGHEIEELKSAALSSGSPQGVRVALALSESDAGGEKLYIASHLPNGTVFKVYVVGVSGTLVNTLSFSTQVDVTLVHRLGVANLRSGGQKIFPRGEYRFYVTAPNQSTDVNSLVVEVQGQTQGQPQGIVASLGEISENLPGNLKILTYKTYFLGGKKDAIYASDLRKYHEELRVKVGQEIVELTQYLGTLESQFSATIAKFKSLKVGKINPKQRQKWSIYHTEWMKLQEQFNQVFVTWTPQFIRDRYHFESLYQLTRQAGEEVNKVHGMQHAYYTGGADLTEFDSQLSQVISSSRSALDLLKNKLTQASSASKSESSVPRRNGF